jgi:predicted P-loop ATPase/GTPase
MTTTYRLHVNELTADLVKSIKSAFKGKTVEITVSDTLDETDYLLADEANRKSLEKSMQQAAAGELVTFTVEEFEEKYGTK